MNSSNLFCLGVGTIVLKDYMEISWKTYLGTSIQPLWEEGALIVPGSWKTSSCPDQTPCPGLHHWEVAALACWPDQSSPSSWSGGTTQNCPPRNTQNIYNYTIIIAPACWLISKNTNLNYFEQIETYLDTSGSCDQLNNITRGSRCV